VKAGINPIRYHNGTRVATRQFLHRGRACALRLSEEATWWRSRRSEAATYSVPASGGFRGITARPHGVSGRVPTASTRRHGQPAAALLIRVLLGLEPDGDELRSDPALPEGIRRIDLSGILGRWAHRRDDEGAVA